MRKIKASRSLTNKEILDLCKQEVTKTASLSQALQQKLYARPSPPANTVAVVVDISPNGGAMKVGENADNELGVKAVGKVGTEDAVDLAVVP